MNKLLLLFLLLIIGPVYAQRDKTAIKYAGYITANNAEKHLTILASDAYEGRETGKPGADKAANYIANEFKKMGLEAPVNGFYFLDVPLVENTLNISFSVNGRPLTRVYDFYLDGAIADKTIDTENIVFVGYGTESELANVDIAGKIILLINEDQPQPGVKTNTAFRPSQARKKIISDLKSKNPALILSANPEMADMYKTFRATLAGSSLSIKKETKPLDTQAAVITITGNVANQLLSSTGFTFAQMISRAASGRNTAQIVKAGVKISYHTVETNVKATDVLGYLPGTDLKNEVLVISAHYDHIGLNATGPDKVNNGADDDGSGTTAVIELARAFMQAKKNGAGPRRGILFLTFTGEEKGLLGSQYYTDHPVFPLANTIADLNMDMTGRISYDYNHSSDSVNNIYPVGSAMLSKELKEISENANDTYTKLHLDYSADDPKDPERTYYRSDHYNFAKHNIPIIFYTDGGNADYHQPGDEVNKINFPLLVKRTQLVFYTAWELANRNKRPLVDTVK